MELLIEKYYKVDDLENIAKENNYDKETYDEFIWYINENLKDEENGNGWEEEGFENLILEYAQKYTSIFSDKRKEGYSFAWSREYAEHMVFNDNTQLLGMCYDAVREASPDKAEDDLLLYCKLKNANDLFTKYFVKWMEEGEGFKEHDAEERANVISETYKKLVAEGKSEVYAFQFAYLSSMFEYNEVYIEYYAQAYNESISDGKDVDYAREYAEKYASELVDVKCRGGISDDEEMLEDAKLTAKVYITGWEYARKNKLKERDEFIKIFENKYMNLYYSDGKDIQKSIVEIEKLAIEKSLEQYNAHMDKNK